jgi:hypothetical protein
MAYVSTCKHRTYLLDNERLRDAKEVAVVASIPVTLRRSSSKKRRAAARAELAASAVRGSRASRGGPPSAGEKEVPSGCVECLMWSAIRRRRLLISTMLPKKMYPALGTKTCTTLRRILQHQVSEYPNQFVYGRETVTL